MHDKLAYIIKHNRFVQLLYRVVMSTIFRLMGLVIPMNNKLVLFSSYGGKQYSDSPRILFEAMKEDDRFKDFCFVWAFEQPDQVTVDGAGKVRTDSLKYFYTALKAKVWITNVNIERGLSFKKKNTVYLNTWHGTGPKKGGNAVNGRKDYDFSRVDLFCCDGQYTHDVFVKWFRAKEESMLWCGRPREDALLAYTEKDRIKIREKLNLPCDRKVILYMPTWREYDNRNLNYKKWETMLGGSYILCVRKHHFTSADTFECGNNAFLRDVTAYPDVNELYLAADILISDYSSAFFDYGLLRKPMICYAYDYEQYKDTYGLFMDLENEFPNGVMKSEDRVIETIMGMDYDEECQKSAAYCGRYVSHPENATRRCLNEIDRRLKTMGDVK